MPFISGDLGDYEKWKYNVFFTDKNGGERESECLQCLGKSSKRRWILDGGTSLRVSLQVQGSLACSILSTALALLGVALLSYTMAALDSAFQQCELSRMSRSTTTSYYYSHREDSSTDLCPPALKDTSSVMLICRALELPLAVLLAVLWWKQAQSDFPGSVLFQPQSYKNDPSIFSKTPQDPEYEELPIRDVEELLNKRHRKYSKANGLYSNREDTLSKDSKV
ncbi:PREDICTED: membrane-spanning 4-domains subfamily A member 6A [Chinchilla lanigera]|uniref:membrane-spanning 4-domains subfamily A member 6A n=1 Tax=Chinchilla lanigera TaxID=34839 RepID=UPI00038EAC66|nr:PREDICTED: membrane-spanning 4-domains subfamily A member 6A [Chinchilla lanigera]